MQAKISIQSHQTVGEMAASIVNKQIARKKVIYALSVTIGIVFTIYPTIESSSSLISVPNVQLLRIILTIPPLVLLLMMFLTGFTAYENRIVMIRCFLGGLGNDIKDIKLRPMFQLYRSQDSVYAFRMAFMDTVPLLSTLMTPGGVLFILDYLAFGNVFFLIVGLVSLLVVIVARIMIILYNTEQNRSKKQKLIDKLTSDMVEAGKRLISSHDPIDIYPDDPF